MFWTVCISCWLKEKKPLYLPTSLIQPNSLASVFWANVGFVCVWGRLRSKDSDHPPLETLRWCYSLVELRHLMAAYRSELRQHWLHIKHLASIFLFVTSSGWGWVLTSWHSMKQSTYPLFHFLVFLKTQKYGYFYLKKATPNSQHILSNYFFPFSTLKTWDSGMFSVFWWKVVLTLERNRIMAL